MDRLATLVGFEIVQLEVVEVAHKDVAGQFLRFKTGEVVNRLFVGLGQVPPERFVFNEQRALPQQVNFALCGAQLVHSLFEAGNLAAGYTEDLKERIPKGLCVSVFALRALPFSGKGGGTCAYFVPA